MRKMMTIVLLLACALSYAWADPIHDAAREGDVATVTRLLAGDPAQLETRDSLGYTPLLCAALAGQTDVMKLLISRGADITAQERITGFTVLQVAARSASLPAVQLIAEQGRGPQSTSSA